VPQATGIIAGPVFVDAHAHLHPCYDLRTYLGAAHRNVSRAARTVASMDDGAVGALLLAEGRGEGAFERLQSLAHTASGSWTVQPTSEPDSLLVHESGVLRLVIMAGRQVVTAEGVEVLGLLTGRAIADGMPLRDTVDALHHGDAVVVLPWGFGKWTMRRGRLVASCMRAHAGIISLGDNGGRLAAAGTPALFAEARQLGVPILPGSDPLPFMGQERRIGSFGFVADTALALARPAEGLRRWLQAHRVQPPVYGEGETFGRFWVNQLRMQWRKRVSRAG
jgi:hypothetical protein